GEAGLFRGSERQQDFRQLLPDARVPLPRSPRRCIARIEEAPARQIVLPFQESRAGLVRGVGGSDQEMLRAQQPRDMTARTLGQASRRPWIIGKSAKNVSATDQCRDEYTAVSRDGRPRHSPPGTSPPLTPAQTVSACAAPTDSPA